MYFGRVSLVALLSNLLIVPAIFLVVCGAFLALAVSAFSWTAAVPPAMAASGLVRLVLSATDWFAGLPFASIEQVYPPVPLLMLAYVLLVMALEWRNRPLRRWLMLAGLLLVNVMVWQGVQNGGRHLRVTFFDVGQGDAALIEFPTKQTLLIDAGPLQPTDSGERILLPALRHKSIASLDAVLLTHPHADHIGGLRSLIRTVKIGNILVADTVYHNNLFRRSLRQARRRHIAIRVLRRGQVLRDFAPAQVWIMGPSPADARRQKQLNHASLLVKVVYGRTSFLFAGDTERRGELQTLPFAKLLHADVLKVGHHGSKTSSHPENFYGEYGRGFLCYRTPASIDTDFQMPAWFCDCTGCKARCSARRITVPLWWFRMADGFGWCGNAIRFYPFFSPIREREWRKIPKSFPGARRE
ncbi:MAG: ComEC/Rec2 family competence protein [candidate division KSB1 bacterium]|nr:ComEC/Rec2 family competence protein [candidate division KSB1 bacterium]